VPTPADEVKAFIQAKGLKIKFILLTHAHFDHIGDLNNFDYPFYIHKDDLALLLDSSLNGSGVFLPSAISINRKPHLYPESSSLDFLSHKLKILHTPGHTPGSVSIKLEKWLFSGDTLFAGSVGRTDFPYGAQEMLITSIKSKILSLDSDTIVYPGHGPETTVLAEKKSNPFL